LCHRNEAVTKTHNIMTTKTKQISKRIAIICYGLTILTAVTLFFIYAIVEVSQMVTINNVVTGWVAISLVASLVVFVVGSMGHAIITDIANKFHQIRTIWRN